MRSLYRLCLHAYPAAFRERHGAEMLRIFESEWRVARAAGMRMTIHGVFHLFFDLARTVTHENLDAIMHGCRVAFGRTTFRDATAPRLTANRSSMKTLRIIATIVIGGYLLAMGLQLIGVSIAIVRDVGGIARDTAGARAAFVPNLLVCVLCTLALWAMWKKKRGAVSCAASNSTA